MMALSLLIAIGAFALFGLSTRAHHERHLGSFVLPRQQRRMRLAAWALVALAFPPAIAARGWVFGPVLWFGALMFGAGAVFLALNFLPARPRVR